MPKIRAEQAITSLYDLHKTKVGLVLLVAPTLADTKAMLAAFAAQKISPINLGGHRITNVAARFLREAHVDQKIIFLYAQEHHAYELVRYSSQTMWATRSANLVGVWENNKIKTLKNKWAAPGGVFVLQ